MATKKKDPFKARPPAWIKTGAVVDYRSIISRPPSRRVVVVRSEPWRLGGGEWVVLIEGQAGGVACAALTQTTYRATYEDDGAVVCQGQPRGNLLGMMPAGTFPLSGAEDGTLADPNAADPWARARLRCPSGRVIVVEREGATGKDG
jgi:hypothetical protein